MSRSDEARDRDLHGRPRSSRPRDELGRPLTRTPTATAATDPPPLPPADALIEAQRLIDTGRAFAAHEVLEGVWKQTTGPDRGLWRGLAQLAVGLTHHARGNPRGARSLLNRAADTLEPYAGSRPHGVAVDELRGWALAAAPDVTAAPAMPRLVAQAADARD